MTAILIIKLGALGDVLRTTCILPGLHQKYPDAHISWLTAANATCLLDTNPLIETVLVINDQSHKLLRQQTYDLVINLEDDFPVCQIASSLHATDFFGAYLKKDRPQYTSDSAPWFDMSLISRFGKTKADRLKQINQNSYPDLLFKGLGLTPGLPCLKVPQHDQLFATRFAENYLANDKLVVGLNTGAGGRWQHKQLSVIQTASLANHLTRDAGKQVLLYGGAGEKERNEQILSLSNGSIVDTKTDNSLLRFAALVNLADVLITSDSLAFHIASALHIKCVVFFGPTSATEIKLFGPGIKIIADIPCICCYRKRCTLTPHCMDTILSHDLINAVNKLL